ncbi:hypothetical protein [Corynebacterium pacaense]|uniref:hypothetical protein n=1 Tax=Corynebacterium pacaense TaxID=1816684 RepID=UPI0009BC1481|nr:hypothetical protein [Corynebacterium pacaense]
MNGTPSSHQQSRGRGVSVVVGIILLIVAVLAVLVGRGMLSIPGINGDNGGELTTISAVIGSEKREFFEDPEVQRVFGDHGYTIRVDTAGSRRIATDVDLSAYDLAFPSSAPAAQKIMAGTSTTGRFTPFHSPIAVATFEPIMGLLAEHGVASRQDGHWIINMAAFLELASSGQRWRDLGEGFASPRVVQFSSTDVRSSNSAAMYLSILAWVANNASVVTNQSEVNSVVARVSPLFLGQGYTESSSAGPFADYLSQGMGAKPMVMVYEAQYLAEQNKPDSRIRGDMVLAYPDPTVLSNHTVVSLSTQGAEIGRLLVEDPELQRLAAEHGFRPQNSALFEQAMGPLNVPSYLNSVDPPDFDVLEELIEGVSAQYNSPPPPEETQQ